MYYILNNYLKYKQKSKYLFIFSNIKPIGIFINKYIILYYIGELIVFSFYLMSKNIIILYKYFILEKNMNFYHY